MLKLQTSFKALLSNLMLSVKHIWNFVLGEILGTFNVISQWKINSPSPCIAITSFLLLQSFTSLSSLSFWALFLYRIRLFPNQFETCTWAVTRFLVTVVFWMSWDMSSIKDYCLNLWSFLNYFHDEEVPSTWATDILHCLANCSFDSSLGYGLRICLSK